MSSLPSDPQPPNKPEVKKRKKKIGSEEGRERRSKKIVKWELYEITVGIFVDKIKDHLDVGDRREELREGKGVITLIGKKGHCEPSVNRECWGGKASVKRRQKPTPSNVSKRYRQWEVETGKRKGGPQESRFKLLQLTMN